MLSFIKDIFKNTDEVYIIVIILLIYFSILIFLKKKKFFHKQKGNNYSNLCPYCKKHPMERIKRKKIDYIINYITFQLFNFKRYYCNECEKSILRWEARFSNKN